MKYYTYVEPTSSEDMEPMYITLSEEEILKEYWDYWYERMCNKFGKEVVDSSYASPDCIDDWITVHWAWQSSKEKYL
jgi:hypothetical protein